MVPVGFGGVPVSWDSVRRVDSGVLPGSGLVSRKGGVRDAAAAAATDDI